jgi:ribosomal protein S21
MDKTLNPANRAAHSLALITSDEREHRHCEKPKARAFRKAQATRAARRLNKIIAQCAQHAE